jgi:hypothetical protein
MAFWFPKALVAAIDGDLCLLKGNYPPSPLLKFLMIHLCIFDLLWFATPSFPSKLDVIFP